jgi:hypothetical protein
MKNLAENIVHDIIDELTDRAGLLDGWFDIDEDTRNEIVSELEAKVLNNLKRDNELKSS